VNKKTGKAGLKG